MHKVECNMLLLLGMYEDVLVHASLPLIDHYVLQRQ